MKFGDMVFWIDEKNGQRNYETVKEVVPDDSRLKCFFVGPDNRWKPEEDVYLLCKREERHDCYRIGQKVFYYLEPLGIPSYEIVKDMRYEGSELMCVFEYTEKTVPADKVFPVGEVIKREIEPIVPHLIVTGTCNLSFEVSVQAEDISTETMEIDESDALIQEAIEKELPDSFKVNGNLMVKTFVQQRNLLN